MRLWPSPLSSYIRRVKTEVGQTLDGRWKLRRLVAEAEEGALYDAAHVHLDRSASLIVAHRQHRDALLREALLREKVDHPNVVRVLDFAELPGGDAYLVGEPFKGRSLDGLLLVRDAFPTEEAVDIALSLGDAVAHLHSLELAHAALSPASVVVHQSRATLLDLGIFPTPLGTVTGSLASIPYTAPERLRGRAPAGPRADVYSVTAMLVEMLTGGSTAEWATHELDFPAPLSKAIRLGLAEAPERHASMVVAAKALREATAAEPLPSSVPPAARRRHPRAPYVSPVRVRLREALVDGRSEDISEGGMLVLGVGDSGVDGGASVLLRFALPMSGKVVSEPATVQWARGARGEALGLSFDQPAERTIEDIRAYVDLVGVNADSER